MPGLKTGLKIEISQARGEGGRWRENVSFFCFHVPPKPRKLSLRSSHFREEKRGRDDNGRKGAEKLKVG